MNQSKIIRVLKFVRDRPNQRMPFLISVTILLFTFFNCNAVVSQSNLEAKITVHLKSNERLFFTYYDDLFRDQMIIFSNPSNSDTSISKKIFLTNPLVLTWQFMISQSHQKTRYSFLVKPNDDIHIGTSFPNIYPISNVVFLVDSTDTFFTTNYFPAKSRNRLDNVGREKQNEQFLADLERGYNAALRKTNKEFELKQIDSVVFENKKWLTISHFYEAIFSATDEFYPNNKMLKTKISAERKNINAFINQKPPVSYGLIRTLMGVRKNDFENTGNTTADYWGMYNDVIKNHNTSYKMPLMLYMLTTPSHQNDNEFPEALNAFNRLFPDKKYLTDSILNAKSPIMDSESNDVFTTMDDIQHKWKDIININSDKVVIVDVWASWCAPCRALFPAFDSVKSILDKVDYQFVSINIDGEKNDWKIVSEIEKRFLANNNFYLENAHQSYFVKALRIESIPRIVVLKNGKVLNSDFYTPTDKSFVEQLKLYKMDKNVPVK